ncbi:MULTISPECIES: AraC family transcriptional regulator [unclassified Marinobacter]|uniref:AraC family transcriptional regulator n=1 Tax=unclassified Marinobacter TaxID=83889 RepID=UPI0019258E82|nr:MULTISPECIES: helix-turn-helix domain-containing protein [unclassified Marinobacter]MBL3827146.1 helix-turn-helix transcriptional regulator [Marinobacter sp. MC3]MBL3895629.1 helix-turn-helix transcriptional regulator [Marinobacter sp. MW3]
MDATRGISGNHYQPPVFHDLDEVNHAISGSNLEFIQLKSGNLDVALDQMSLGDLSIDVGAVNLPIRVMGELDPGRFSIGVFTRGAQATWNGNHVDDSQLLVFPPGKELSGYASTMYGWTSLIIPPAWIDVIEQSTSRTNITQVASCITTRPAPETLAELKQAISNVFRLTESPLAGPAEEWLVTDLRNMLGAVLSAMDVPPAKVSSQARGHFIVAKRAERYMRERTEEPLSIDVLCVAMNVSRRYLEYAFADAFGTSPSRYLRLMRLHQVRSRLKASRGQTTVTNEALRLGFSHLSLFATQYKNAFGECPSQTLARATR